MRYTAAIVYLQRSLAVVYITLLKGVFGGVPLPEVCLSRRADRNAPDTISRDCTNTERVHRFFFHARRLRCKKFSLCPSLAVYLDEQCDADNNLNYFQSRANCEESCTNGEHAPSFIIIGFQLVCVTYGLVCVTYTELLFHNKPYLLGCLFTSCCSCGVFSGTIE